MAGADSFGVPLGDMLNKRDHYFMVPRMQRAYRWQEDRVIRMVLDMWSTCMAVDRNRNYFMGSIILKATAHRVYDVYDGQQRLTSYSLLCAALMHTLSQINDNTLIEAAGIISSQLSGMLLDSDTRSRSLIVKPRLQQMNVERRKMWAGAADDPGGANYLLPVHIQITNVLAKIRTREPDNNMERFGQYGLNYAALCKQLAVLVVDLSAVERLDKLSQFYSFIIDRVKVQKVVASTLEDARNAFFVSCLPGEPLDLPTLLKTEMLSAANRITDDSSENFLNAFDTAMTGIDFAKDDRAVMVAVRVLLGRVTVCNVVVNPLPEEIMEEVNAHQNLHGVGPDIALTTIRRALLTHNEMLVFEDVNKSASYRGRRPLAELQRAVQVLFGLERAAARGTGELMTRDTYFLWRAVAVQLLLKLDINNISSIAGAKTAMHDFACGALVRLERVILYCNLQAGIVGTDKLLATRLNAIMREIEAVQIGGDIVIPSLDLSPDELQSVSIALDKPFYNRHNAHPSVTVMRHLLLRLNEFHCTRFGHRLPTDGDLIFQDDWTTEHIYPQTIQDVDAPTADDDMFFRQPDTMFLHCLGNLTPLDTNLQNAAGNNPFYDKRQVYNIANNALTRHLGIAYPSSNFFSKDMFNDRHKRCKELLLTGLFGMPAAPMDRDGGAPAANAAAMRMAADDVDIGAAAGAGTGLDAAGVLAAAPLPHVRLERRRADIIETLDALPRWQFTRAEWRRGDGNPGNNPAYELSLNTITDLAQREEVRGVINFLAGNARQIHEVAEVFFLLAGETDMVFPPSRITVNTRRRHIIHRFLRGYVTLEHLRNAREYARVFVLASEPVRAGVRRPRNE